MTRSDDELTELAKSLGDRADLDPTDWSAFRRQSHAILDDMIDYIETIRGRPVWTKTPDDIRAGFNNATLPVHANDLSAVHAEFMTTILPYTIGNTHPRFMGWVHGGGNAVGMIGEMVAAAINANLGGRDHAPIEVEQQVVRWFAEAFGLPATTTGLLLTGSSIANFIAVHIARVASIGPDLRRKGISGHPLVGYAATTAHSCVPKAFDMAGMGSESLRLIPVNAAGRMDVGALARAIDHDLHTGHRPFLVVASAGTVDCGAIDDLPSIARLCREKDLWFHVDGAFGALGMLSPTLRPLLAGLERADSVAFDFHKWGQIPYDAGCILVRDGDAHKRAFATEAAYLRREERGLAGGALWPCDLGPDLSRGFRALKVWYTLKVLGTERLAAAIERTCDLARYLAKRVDLAPELERMTPTSLNIVCFRYRFSADIDHQNAELAADIQESGVAVVSTSKIGGQMVLRCAIVNHRSRVEDMDDVVDIALTLGRRREALSS